jgi:sulfatase maturation enzyme AslB (radical SAM superfamily)
MGMDPLSQDENWEVTIALEGPLKVADYRRFRAELDAFFDKVAAIANTHAAAPAGAKLQVRLVRSGVRRTA